MGIRSKKRWDSCLLWFVASLSALGLTLSCINANGDVHPEPEAETADVRPEAATADGVNGACGSSDDTNVFNRKLLFVSTLDGKLSALDVKEDGQLLWSMAVDSRALLSSSISKLEIMDGGIVTRYIPSLNGNLYKYDGESIEAVPMSADTLLSSSYKLGDNTMVIGGKDILTYGIDPNTGQIRYACGVKGCRVFGSGMSEFDDLLMVTRSTKTVRGVDASNGHEKWNFSVGQHDIKFIKGQKKVITEDVDEDATVVTCPTEEEDGTEVDMKTFSDSIKLVVPEGMVVGVDPENMHSVAWKFKFKSPISSAWLLYKGELQEVGMFDNHHIPALSSFDPEEEQPLHQPLLYVGMHQGQLYVQQSSQMQERITQAADTLNKQGSNYACARSSLPKVAWKPYLNTAHWRTPAMNNRQPAQIAGQSVDENSACGNEEQEEDGEEEDTSALTIWHENYPFDNGFYLYPEFTVPAQVKEPEKGQTDGNQSEHDFLFDDFYPVTVTLWTWWKEVIAISTVTSVIISFLVHILLTRTQRKLDLTSTISSNSLSKSDSVSTPTSDSKDSTIDIDPPSRQNSDEANYVSRYCADFDHIHILGKGGFGVVFESKNKVDDCHYAVKRIALPNSDGAKEKVMREVKALAKLDHVGIVRYFHAWIECPPAGWQEERDHELEFSECPTSQTPGATVSRMETTSYTQSSYVPGSSPKSSQMKEAVESLKSSPKASSPLDFLKNPFGGNNFDFIESEEANVKRGGSEEFSVHSQSHDLWGSGEFTGDDLESSEDEESGSFSCLGTPKLTQFELDESVDVEFRLSDGELSHSANTNFSNSNIPFLNNDSSRNTNDHIEDVDDDSVQIVFEDSGCADKSSKESSSCNDCNVIRIDQSDQRSDSCEAKSSGTLSICNTNRSRTHSRTPSYTKLTYETEGKNRHHQKGCNSSKELLPLPKLYLFIQMQLCKKETLKDWLALNTLNRDRHMLLDVFDQMTSAIEYVHELGLMHRDLKPSNIFFSLDGVVKMGDFGLVTAQPEEQNESQSSGNPFRKHTARVGTQLYMSPEQTNGKVYTQKVDIYALGVILFELLYPFATQMERVRTLLDVRKRHFPERFSREMPNECAFAKRLLSEKSEERPTAKEILSSDLLSEFEARRIPRRFRSRTISQNSS